MTSLESTVPTRRVGTSGLLVSAVGLGCNNFGRPGTSTETLDGTIEVLDAAIDAGVTSSTPPTCTVANPASVRR